MLEYDPASSLQHYPVGGGMRRFGLNPYGDPLYRVVFAPSRRYLVVGEWPDGSDCARWTVKHKNVGPVWIMERWLPAAQFAKCTKDEWNRDMLVLGPWPERGEYELCHVFDVAPPADANIQTLITWIEAGKNISYAETLTHHREQADQERKTTRSTADAIIRNRLPAFGARCFVGGHGHRGSKTAPVLRSAEELGLPTTSGVRTGKRVTRLIESSAAQAAA